MDGDGCAIGQDAAQGNQDGLIRHVRSRWSAVHGDVPEPERTDPRGDGVELDPVDGATGCVTDLDGLVQADRPAGVTDGGGDVVGRDERDAGAVYRSG